MSLSNRKSMEPWLKDDVEFYEHQVTGIRQMMQMRSFLLADEMGLGKSLQAITVAIGDVFQGWSEKILIVAPVTLKGNWSDEFKKFTTIPSVILGQEPDPKRPGFLRSLTPGQRVFQLAQFAAMKGPRALITNYEQVGKHLADLNKIGFDIAVFDECHYMKNPRSKRTQACHKIRARRNFMLSGTPMLNRVDELWGTLHMIDRDAYPKYWSFRNRYCVMGGFDNKQIVGTKNEKELTSALSQLQIRRYKKDVLDLPPIQFIKKKVYLTDQQQRIYDKLEEELIIEMNGEAKDVEHAMVKVMRLRQICGTTVPFTGEDHSAKLDLAQEDALEIMESGHKIVAFSQDRNVVEAYCNRLDKVASQFDIWELHGDVPIPDRVKLVHEWSDDPKPGIIVCMLQVAGVGLNMTAAHHVQMLDKLWVPGLNQQGIDRTHRIGTTESVQVLEYLCRNTAEVRVEAVLRDKEKQTGDIIDSTWSKTLLNAIMNKYQTDDD